MFNLPIGFGVVVSLRERDWTNSLREEEGDAKDFPAFLGFLRKLEQRPYFGLAFACVWWCLLSVQRLLAQGDSDLSFHVN